MAVKILLIGARICRNLGGPSLLVSTRKVIDKYFDNPEYIFISPTSEDISLSAQYNINIISCASWSSALKSALVKRLLRLPYGTEQEKKVVAAFEWADIVIDIWGIEFADSLRKNTIKSRVSNGFHFVIGKLYNKPVIKYTADLGPFENKLNRFCAKRYFKYGVDLIINRSEISQKRIQSIGITTPSEVCPDTAFIFPAAKSKLSERILKGKKGHPIVGFSISHMAARQSGNEESYCNNMAQLADYIIDKHKAKILLIPNERSSNVSEDDLYYINKTWTKIINKKNAIVISDDLSAAELKGIISCSDIVIASRYHTIIASLSIGIPVLVVGWHFKYEGVLKLFGMEHFQIKVDKISINELKEKFDRLWRQRASLRKSISGIIPQLVDEIYKGGGYVFDIYAKKLDQITSNH